MMVVIAYDISTKEITGCSRLRKVQKLCLEYGVQVQKSVYECEMDNQTYQEVKRRIEKLISYEADTVRFYLLGNRYQQRIEGAGKSTIGWDRDTYVV